MSRKWTPLSIAERWYGKKADREGPMVVGEGVMEELQFWKTIDQQQDNF